jgi:hypothetical protein
VLHIGQTAPMLTHLHSNMRLSQARRASDFASEPHTRRGLQIPHTPGNQYQSNDGSHPKLALTHLSDRIVTCYFHFRFIFSVQDRSVSEFRFWFTSIGINTSLNYGLGLVFRVRLDLAGRNQWQVHSQILSKMLCRTVWSVFWDQNPPALLEG